MKRILNNERGCLFPLRSADVSSARPMGGEKESRNGLLFRFLIGRWTGLSTLLIFLIATPPATADPQLDFIKQDLARFEKLVPEISDETYRKFITETLDNLKGRLAALQTTFDQTACDELKVRAIVEYQRCLASLAPLKQPSLEIKAVSPQFVENEDLSPFPPTVTSSPSVPADEMPISGRLAFIENHCTSCHDDAEKKGNLDLTNLAANDFPTWVKIHDRVASGEMPPKKKKRPDAGDLASFIGGLSTTLTETDRAEITRDGRAMQRRLNAYEYENALRDLLYVPWLQIKGSLPDDGVANRFNKSGRALDISHVQMARFMSIADLAIRDAISVQAARPPTTTRRLYARDQKYLIKEYKKVPFNPWPDRQNIPLLGSTTDIETRLGRAPLTVGESDPVKRELEGVGWVGIAFPKWDRTPLPVAGRYRLRYMGHTIWVGPNGYSNGSELDPVKDAEKLRRATRWYLSNVDDVSAGRGDEPISVYAEGGGQNRRLGGFDLTPEPKVHELEVWLSEKESVMPRATSLYQPRPDSPTNPRARIDGAPGVAFRWLEIEGPLYDEATTDGYRLLFGDLPLKKFANGGRDIIVESANPKADAERLLRGFVAKAFRRPAKESDIASLLHLIHAQLDAGLEFSEAMIAGYTAALAAPGFLVVKEQPGTLDAYSLASRLSLFLWNSPPDEALLALAANGDLLQPEVLRRETERLLTDSKSSRFVDAFLDYWLDLRKLEETSPSPTLYNDYFSDDGLLEASLAEPRLFFTELLQRDLPARNVVASDFTFLNERLARHYGVPGVSGVAMRRVALPADSPRGGFLTQAGVLKVTANGTTTSPVLRGKWITERIFGRDIPPPPPVGAVEPDIRGAVTIRQQLEAHREDASCASCHITMDPPGFALENFDVLGGWRDHYRAVAPGKPTVTGFGKDGGPFDFHVGLPVDAAGELPDGRQFKDIREFKRLLLETEAQETQTARNLVQQLVIFATGSPVRFADRPAVETILQRSRESRFGVRRIVHEIIQSPMFQNK